MSAPTPADAAGADVPARRMRAMRGAVMGIIGLAYALLIWNAVYTLVEIADAGINGYGWALLLMPVVVPVVILLVALVLTRRRRLGALVVAMLAGLGLSAAFWLDTLGYALRNGASLLN